MKQGIEAARLLEKACEILGNPHQLYFRLNCTGGVSIIPFLGCICYLEALKVALIVEIHLSLIYFHPITVEYTAKKLLNCA